MKERLCLEVERLGLSAVIMGSRGFGATRKMGGGKGGIVGGGRLGSVSDYCVQHCVCPVVVVRCNDDGKEGESVKIGGLGEEIEEGLHPVPEEDQEECVDDELKGLYFGTFCVIFRYEMMSFLFCDVGFVFVWGNFGLGD
jgi:hypothetical protein